MYLGPEHFYDFSISRLWEGSQLFIVLSLLTFLAPSCLSIIFSSSSLILRSKTGVNRAALQFFSCSSPLSVTPQFQSSFCRSRWSAHLQVCQLTENQHGSELRYQHLVPFQNVVSFTFWLFGDYSSSLRIDSDYERKKFVECAFS